MDKKILYKKAYRILDASTPLSYDCGILCNHKCCQGDDDDGMIIFPGEEIMFANEPYLTIREIAFGNSKTLFATCQGKCNRNFRPLSCRIFPLVPYIDSKDMLYIINDPRARYLCPLIMGIEQIKISASFKRNVRKVFQLLSQDDDVKEYLIKLSRILEEYLRFMPFMSPYLQSNNTCV